METKPKSGCMDTMLVSILVFILLSIGCSGPPSLDGKEIYAHSEVAIPQGVVVSKDSYHSVKLHKIDSCEYLTYGETIIHKFNCSNTSGHVLTQRLDK